MNDLVLLNERLNQNGYWNKPIQYEHGTPDSEALDLYEQNGYDLTELEQRFAKINLGPDKGHRYRRALKYDWFAQSKKKTTGAVLNHACLFERKAYTGAAKEQLETWAKENNLIYKLIAMRPKWGLDFSIDYVDAEGNAFEVFHWEFDGFDFAEINKKKKQMEGKLLSIDWDKGGRDLLERKDEWHGLGFFEQSDWKCNFFDIEKERFKMVIWS